MARGRQSPLDRFLERLNCSLGPDDCWTLMGGSWKSLYGTFSINGKPMPASRAAYILMIGDPGRLFVCHSCDQTPCCNTGHLFLGTAADNHADMVLKGRSRLCRPVLFDDYGEPYRYKREVGRTVPYPPGITPERIAFEERLVMDAWNRLEEKRWALYTAEYGDPWKKWHAELAAAGDQLC